MGPLTRPPGRPVRPAVKFRLRISAGPGEGVIVPLSPGPPLVIGRSPQATIRLPEDQKLSRKHCELTWRGSGWIIKNTSKSGTRVGGAPLVTARNLLAGDTIELGMTTLVFEEDHDEMTVVGSALPVIGALPSSEAGYDDEGTFHAGYTTVGRPPEPPKATGHRFFFAMVMTASALAGGGVLFAMLLQPMLRRSPTGLPTSALLAVPPVLAWLLLYKFLDRNGRIPARNYLACFAWGATAACAISALVNLFARDALVSVAGGVAGRAAGAIILAPILEESAKGLAVLVVFWLLKEEFDNSVTGLILGAASGLGFALVENWYYGMRYLSTGMELDELARNGAVRALGCALLGHPIYTALTGLGLGLVRELKARAVLAAMVALAGWMAAVVLHAAWNLSSMAFDASARSVPVLILAGANAAFFVIALIYSLAQERRMLLVYLRKEVRAGFIEPEELTAFRKLFGRERYVLAGRIHGTGALRKELRRAQLALAFRKWHLEQGDARRGEDIDEPLYDARIRIRDARNAINAAEGVVARGSLATLQHRPYVPGSRGSRGPPGHDGEEPTIPPDAGPPKRAAR